MKNYSIPLVLAVMCVAAYLDLPAQKLARQDVPMNFSKEAMKKGMYVNTRLDPEGSVSTFVAYDLKKGVLGFDVSAVDLSGNLLYTRSETASPETQDKYGIVIPDPGKVVNPGQGLRVLRLVTSTGVLGKLKIEEGVFEPKYATDVDYGGNIVTYTPILRGFKFKSEKVTESDMRLNIFAVHCDKGIDLEENYNILEGLIPNTVGYYNRNGTIAFMGKDARFDKDSPNAQNVITTGKFDGKTQSFSNIQQHVLAYNLAFVTAGFDGKGNRSVLVSTLNAPTTISAHKKFQADGKPFMTYLTFDTEGNVLENVTFESLSVRGDFGLYGTDETTFVLGSVDGDHKGYYRFDTGKPTHFQIVKIENGAVTSQQKYSIDQIRELLITPGGKKGKTDWKDIDFLKFEKLPNGEHLAYAQSPGKNLIFHFNRDAVLLAVYLTEKLPDGKMVQTGVHSIIQDGKVWLVYTEQTPEIALGLQKSYSRNSGTYMKDVNFSRVDEVLSFARVVRLDPVNKTVTEPVDFVKDVVLGNNPLFAGKNGELLLPVRDLKKKNYRISVVR